MAGELRQTIFGDVRRIINDAFEFFAPPAIEASIAVFVFWYVCGVGPLERLLNLLKTQVSFLATTDVTGVLGKYNLTALVPIAILFVFAVLTYVTNRIIFGVATLLPINIITTSDLIELRLNEDPFWQDYMKDKRPFSGYRLVNYAVAKARYEKKEALLVNLDYFQKESARASQLFAFGKFLLAWTIACGVLSLKLDGATPFSYDRIFLLLLLVIVFGVYCACKYACIKEQLSYAQLDVARAVLETDNSIKSAIEAATSEPLTEEQRSQARQSRMTFLRTRRWWWLGLRLMDLWQMLKYYRFRETVFVDPRKNVVLQATLQNSVNILWFILGALLVWIVSRFSWWLSSVLFVGYLSVTIVDCLLVLLLVASTIWRSTSGRIRLALPASLKEMLPSEVITETVTLKQEQYWLVVSGLKCLEGVLGLLLSRLLATYLFRSL
jgi:hypothetical protein